MDMIEVDNDDEDLTDEELLGKYESKKYKYFKGNTCLFTKM